MSNFLRRPWIKSLTIHGARPRHPAAQITSIRMARRECQLSDKFHVITAEFAEGLEERLATWSPDIRIGELRGAIVQLVEYEIRRDFSSNEARFVIVIHQMLYVGSANSDVFGNPIPIERDADVQKSNDQQRVIRHQLDQVWESFAPEDCVIPPEQLLILLKFPGWKNKESSGENSARHEASAAGASDSQADSAVEGGSLGLADAENGTQDSQSRDAPPRAREQRQETTRDEIMPPPKRQRAETSDKQARTAKGKAPLRRSARNGKAAPAVDPAPERERSVSAAESVSEPARASVRSKTQSQRSASRGSKAEVHAIGSERAGEGEDEDEDDRDMVVPSSQSPPQQREPARQRAPDSTPPVQQTPQRPPQTPPPASSSTPRESPRAALVTHARTCLDRFCARENAATHSRQRNAAALRPRHADLAWAFTKQFLKGV